MLDRAIHSTAEPGSFDLGSNILGFGGGRCHGGHAETHNEEQYCLEKLHFRVYWR
jgi:hypothetical protein